MKLCVYGMWHLGTVIAACTAAEGYKVIGVDGDNDLIASLRESKVPFFEPGLDELLTLVIAQEDLKLVSDPAVAVSDANVVWIAFDTKIDAEERAEVAPILEKVEEIFPYLDDDAVVLVSTQLPVGTIKLLEQRFASLRPNARVRFACSPENLRLGQAIVSFRNPERIVIGVRDDRSKLVLEPLFRRFCDNLIWTSVESAEMAKHALNSFLAVSITFANEIAAICERVGASAMEVETVLRSEPRIGSKAYIRPGAAFSGGTLQRDVQFLNELASNAGLTTPLISGVIPSNLAHRGWPIRCLQERLVPNSASVVAILGLAYKPGTNVTRRSLALDIARELFDRGHSVRAYDPMVRSLPDEFSSVVICNSVAEAIEGADGMVVTGNWPDFSSISTDSVVAAMKRPLVIDQGSALSPSFASDARIEYLSVGTPS